MPKLTVEKTIHRAVACERCGCEYGYRLSAKGTAEPRRPHGVAGALYDIAVDPEVELRESAYRDAYKRLGRTHRFVACPKCRWYQKKMTHAYGMQQLRWLRYVALACRVPAGAAGFMAMVFFIAHDWGLGWLCALIAVVFAAAAIGALWLQNARAAKFDLNAGYPDHLAPYPNEPQAILNRPPNPYAGAGIDDETKGWYAASEGQQLGPYSWTEVYNLVAAHQLQPTDHLLPPNGTEWIEIRSFAELNIYR